MFFGKLHLLRPIRGHIQIMLRRDLRCQRHFAEVSSSDHRRIDQLLKRLKEDMPDRQTELDALDEIEKAVRLMKESVKERKD